MSGRDVHSWNYGGFPVEMIDPELSGGPRGHVLVQKEPDIYDNKTLLELDWNGNIVWEWGRDAPGGAARQNHDLARLPNRNTLVLAHVKPVVESAVPDNDQAIYEVTPQGEVIWKWYSLEHIDEFGFSPEAKELLLRSSKMRTRSSPLVLNDMSPLGPNHWYDSGDARFHPDNIMIDAREASFIAIIEKSTGRIVWRLGPDYPGAYDFSRRSGSREVPRAIDLIVGQHDAHMIARGMPGAGNLLVFDNQGSAGFPPFHGEFFPASRVLEIDPVACQIVWQYDATSSNNPYWSFFSSFISSARRLPNGNTLICEGMHGRVFQVAPAGKIVWEYVNPHFGEHGTHLVDTGSSWANWIFRAQPIAEDWVPEGTPQSVQRVAPPKLTEFRIG